MACYITNTKQYLILTLLTLFISYCNAQELNVLRIYNADSTAYIMCTSQYELNNVVIESEIDVRGTFSNGKDILTYGSRMVIDSGYKHRYSNSVNTFLKHLNVGSTIKVEYKFDPDIYTEFYIDEETYNSIINFYKL